MTWLMILCACIWTAANAQILQLDQGKVQGFEYKTESGNVAEVFLNIPFALPPIADLRFEKPKSQTPWDGIRNGTVFGPACIPIVPEAVLGEQSASEDCLTLNIIRPKKAQQIGEGLPILFIVHGGGYQMLSAVLSGYKALADTYISKDIIIVTIQYRLAVYGFFSTGDERIPGNLGLYDMAEALRFVHSNAKNIGGDPSRITTWGDSAGGAASGQLILSPVSREYLAGSIESSGSPWASWTIGSNVVDRSIKLATRLGCADNVKQCLKNKSIEEIAAATREMFLKHPNDLVASAPPKNCIVGITAKEASLFTVLNTPFNFLSSIKVNTSDFSKFNRIVLVDTLKKFIDVVYVGDHLDELVDEVVTYYVDREAEDNFAFYLDRYVEFVSDVLFNIPAVDGILARSKAGWKVYTYVFDHHNDESFDAKIPKRLRRATHASDYYYAVGVKAMRLLKSYENDKKVAEILQNTIAEFVKKGRPADLELWPETSADQSISYLEISSDPKKKTELHKEAASFWHKMKKYGFDLVQLLPVDKSEYAKEEL
ncbi:unnamed protein product [Cylicocyclus nassatus]|uniref:Carboxylesterase type B domain-containing protein n=1 Tax=Cylicocyclus nassatus TaxID=53992 RepID=A0AA36DK98_CYLNA|nr:unnamed protein product [Cylicocyclus nassatus]